MHDDSLCAMIKMTQTENKKQETRQEHRVQEATKLNAETGIPPARIPEITKSSHSGMTHTLTLWSKHRQRRVATKVVRRATAVKQESETWSSVKMTAKLRHSGRAQSPLSCPFSSISITITVVGSTTVLVLLQVVFMVWKIVLIISTW